MAEIENPESRTSEATKEADRRDAQVKGTADRPPTAEEESDAPDTVDPSVARNFQEANERGVQTLGEGRIDVDAEPDETQ